MPLAYDNIQQIEPSELTTIDLLAEIPTDGSPVEAFRFIHSDVQQGEMIWYPDVCRAGVCFGGDSTWTDAVSPIDSIKRVLSGDIIS